jgi:putative ABC transport system permease protein
MSRLRSAVGQFVADIREQKLRTALTILGITWGTVAVVCLLAFGIGLERQTRKRFHGLGDRVAMVFGGRTQKPYQGFPNGRWIRLVEEDVHLVEQEVPEVVLISPEYSGWGTQVRYGRSITNPNVTGVYPSYTYLRNVIPEMGGRFINDEDIEHRRRVAFIGNRVMELLFGDEADPAGVVGKQVMVGMTPFTVVGVMRPKQQSSSYSSRDRDRVFIPASTHHAIVGRRYLNNIVFRADNAEASQVAQRKIREVLGHKYKFDPTDEDALPIWDTTEFERMFEYLFLGFNMFFAIVGSFTLTVGGIGVANIMFVVVKERTKEIGIRRSVGARRLDIMREIFLESMAIVTIGAVLGLILSVGIVYLLSFIPMREFIGTPVISRVVAVVTVMLLALVGMAAGFFPARKAAGLEPVECLRY